MGHEAHAVRQPEQATLASHGLADQKRLGVRVVQTGRVELHELHVGHPVACPPCRCHVAAMPSPVALSRLLVYRYALPAQPVTRIVRGACKVTTSSFVESSA